MNGPPLDVMHVLASWLPWLTTVAVAGSMIALVAVGCARLGRAPAETRVVVWRAAAVALLLVPAFLLFAATGLVPSPGVGGYAHQMTELVLDRASVPTPAERERATSEMESAASEALMRPTGREAHRTANSQTGGSGVAAPWLEGGIVISWGLGVLGLLIHLLTGILSLNWHGRSANIVDPATVAWARERLTRSGRFRDLRILRGGPFGVPVCWGFRRSTILLPESSGGWTKEHTRAVLEHEITHLVREDPLFLVLSRAATALHWFNPLAWLIQTELGRDAETVCDGIVLRRGTPASVYARVLLQTARDARSLRSPRVSPGMADSGSGSLERRIERILEGARPPARSSAGMAGIAAILLVTVAATLAAVPGGETTSSASATPVQSDTVTNQEILDALILALADPAPPVRRSAVNSLRVIGDSKGLRALETVLDDPDPDVRRAAEEVLGLRPARANMVLPASPAGERPARALLDSLGRQLDVDDDQVRLQAVRRLGNLADRRTTAGLVERLEDDDIRVREAAAAALGNVGDADATIGLIAAWPDPNDHVRMSLVSALGAIGEREGARIVIEGLSDTSMDVRRVSAEALGKLGRAAAQSPPQGESSSVQPVRPTPAVCQTVPTLHGTPSLANAVTTLLENPDAESRERAARAIQVLAPRPTTTTEPTAAPQKDHYHALNIGLSDPSPAVRIAAACSLAYAGDERSLEHLAMRARTSEPETLREVARWAIEQIEARASGSP